MGWLLELVLLGPAIKQRGPAIELWLRCSRYTPSNACFVRAGFTSDSEHLSVSHPRLYREVNRWRWRPDVSLISDRYTWLNTDPQNK